MEPMGELRCSPPGPRPWPPFLQVLPRDPLHLSLTTLEYLPVLCLASGARLAYGGLEKRARAEGWLESQRYAKGRILEVLDLMKESGE